MNDNVEQSPPKKRGRKPGSSIARPPVETTLAALSVRPGSIRSFMLMLRPGQSVVIPCEVGTPMAQAMSAVTGKTRYPKTMDGWEFTSSAVTVVSGIGQAFSAIEVTRLV